MFLRKESIAAAIFFDSDPNIFYLSGIELEKCFLVVPSNDEPYFIVSMLEAERISRFSRIKNIDVFNTAAERDVLTSKFLKQCMIGVCKDRMTVKYMELFSKLQKNLNLTDISGKMAEFREVKTKSEIGIIKEACRITDSIIGRCVDNFDFRTELEVKNYLENEVRKSGNRLSFDTIVASGKNASMPHYFGNGKLLKGFCVIDFGIRHNGYCSDVTRTVFIGNPSRQDRQLYDLVKASQRKGFDAISDGAFARDVDAASRNALGKYKPFFIHGLGHHIGVEVHDAGFRISPNSKGVLRAGMAITVEPGIYIKGKLGIRIEDDVLVENLGFSLLSNLNSGLVVV